MEISVKIVSWIDVTNEFHFKEPQPSDKCDNFV